MKTGAKIATENTRSLDFSLTRKIFTLNLPFCASLSIALKLVLNSYCVRSDVRRKVKLISC